MPNFLKQIKHARFTFIQMISADGQFLGSIVLFKNWKKEINKAVLT